MPTHKISSTGVSPSQAPLPYTAMLSAFGFQAVLLLTMGLMICRYHKHKLIHYLHKDNHEKASKEKARS
jgi:hypothetical protein